MNGYIDKKLNRHLWIVSGAYAAAGAGWILISDPLLALLTTPDQLTRLQSWKGILFIAVTTCFLFLLISRKNAAIKDLFDRLKDQIKHFRDTFEQAAVGIVHISKDEQWIRVNQTICDLLGYNHQDFKSLSLEEIIHPEDLEKGREMDRKLSDSELDSYVMHKRYLTREGGHIYARLTKSAVRDSDGNPEYMIAIIEDITAQKKAEQELERSLQEKKMLLAEIHHRVKNNLAVISGLMELQAYSSDDLRVRRVLQESMMRIKSMALIHESYYEEGTLSHVTINSYLRDFIEYIHQAYSDGMQIELDVAPLKLNINQAMPCGLLLTELLIGCHVGNEQQPVRVTLRQSEEGRVTMSVSGGSVGFTGIDGKPSLARTIIDALVSQLEGTQELEIKGDRTEVTVSFNRKGDKKGSSSAFLNTNNPAKE